MNTNNTFGGNDNEIVNVPVPKKHFSRVMQLIGQLMTEDASQPQIVQEASVPRSPFGFADTNKDEPYRSIIWDQSAFERLRATLKNKAALTALDLTAEKSNRAVYVTDVMQATGATHGEVKAGMGSLTKAIKKAFGLKHNNFNWPAPFHWDHEKQLAFYMMEPAVAEAWKASRTS